ncbi:MAG: M48 family metallopeptidase [Candidatus Omnitrophica bacterium]|nr:M48 family metallopeptidase [Candidatus Omnitrophota bacterium]
METTKCVRIEGVGNVLFAKSKRAKNLSISLKPYNPVRIAVPLGVSFERAKKIVQSKIDWIRKHYIRISEIEKKHKSRLKNLGSINKNEARKKLISRLEELSKQHGFTYNRIFIRNQRTRWGSCSAKNNINLNIKLIQLPDKLIDYIILHELVHTRIKNHSKDFWTELNRLIGNARILRAEIRTYYLQG